MKLGVRFPLRSNVLEANLAERNLHTTSLYIKSVDLAVSKSQTNDGEIITSKSRELSANSTREGGEECFKWEPGGGSTLRVE